MEMKSVFKTVEGKNAILAFYDSLLEKWPVPFEKLVLDTRHGETFVIASGDKSLPPLLLIHGSSSNSAMWIDDVKTYCRHFRVYAADIPGEPGKSRDERPDLKSPAYTEWLEDVFAALKIEKASIAGISLGGWMALKYSTVHPEKVEKLVLLCPSGIGPQKTSFALYAIYAMFFGKRGFDKIVKRMYHGTNIATEAVEYSRLISENFTPYTGVVPVFGDELLKHLNMPVLLIAGDRDILLDSKKSAARLEKLVPHAQIKLLPGAGHVLVNLSSAITPFLLS